MEYDKLRLILPNEPKTWTIQDVGKWLQFIGLETLHPLFRQASIDGSCLEILLDSDLEEIGVDSNIKRKKILQWISIGLKEYNKYLKNRPQKSSFQPAPNSIQLKSIANFRQPLEQSNANYDSKVLDEKEGRKINQVKADELFPGISNPRMNIFRQPLPNGSLGSVSSGLGSITEQQLAAQLRRENIFVTLLDQSFCSPGGIPPEEENYEYKHKKQQPVIRRSPERRIFSKGPQQQTPSAPYQEQVQQNRHIQQTEQSDEVPRFGPPVEKPNSKPFEGVSVSLIRDPQRQQIPPNSLVLRKENASFGRNPECQFKIPSENVSRVHAWLIYKEPSYYIQDRGSLLGTHIFLQGRTLVKQGFILEMGSYDYTIQSVQIQGEECSVNLVGESGSFTFQLMLNQTVMIFGTQNVPALSHDPLLNILHAQWSYTDEGLVVEDLDSSNGTWLRLSKPNSQSLLFPITTTRVVKIANYIIKITPQD